MGNLRKLVQENKRQILLEEVRRCANNHKAAVNWLLTTIRFVASYPDEIWKDDNARELIEIANSDYKMACRSVVNTKRAWNNSLFKFRQFDEEQLKLNQTGEE